MDGLAQRATKDGSGFVMGKGWVVGAGEGRRCDACCVKTGGQEGAAGAAAEGELDILTTIHSVQVDRTWRRRF